MYLKKSIDAINGNPQSALENKIFIFKRSKIASLRISIETVKVTFFSERSRNKYFKLFYTLDGGTDLIRPSSEFLVYWDNKLNHTF
jgi:hypothetical protein